MTPGQEETGQAGATAPYPVPPALQEPLGSVTRVLSLDADGPDSFTAGSLPQLSGRVYGGQVVSQGLLAAAATLVLDEDGPRCIYARGPRDS